MLGFRIDPIEKLNSVCQMIKSLHKVFSTSPYYGVEFERSLDKVLRHFSVVVVVTQHCYASLKI